MWRTSGLPGIVLFIWILLLAWSTRNTLFVRRRAMDNFTSIDAAAGVQIAIVLITAFALLASRRLDKGFFGPTGSVIRLLSLYYGVCALSFAWSAIPVYTLYRAGEALVMFAATFAAISSSRRMEDAERTWFAISLITIFLSMGQNVVLQGISAMTSLTAWHTNTYTAVGAMLAAYCLGEHRAAQGERKRRLRIVGLLGFAAVVVGTSSASNVSLVAGVMAVALLQRRYGILAMVGFSSTVFLTYLLVIEGSLFGVFDWLFPGKTEAAVENLGGRTILWESYWEAILRKPILGHGFAVLSLESGYAIRLYSHNSYLAAILAAGVFGVILVNFVLIRLARLALRALRSRRIGAVGGAAALCVGLVNSIAMPVIFDQWDESVLAYAALIGFLSFFVWHRPKSENSGTAVHATDLSSG